MPAAVRPVRREVLSVVILSRIVPIFGFKIISGVVLLNDCWSQ